MKTSSSPKKLSSWEETCSILFTKKLLLSLSRLNNVIFRPWSWKWLGMRGLLFLRWTRCGVRAYIALFWLCKGKLKETILYNFPFLCILLSIVNKRKLKISAVHPIQYPCFRQVKMVHLGENSVVCMKRIVMSTDSFKLCRSVVSCKYFITLLLEWPFFFFLQCLGQYGNCGNIFFKVSWALTEVLEINQCNH